MVRNFVVLKISGCEYCARYEVCAPFLDMDIIYYDFGDFRVDSISKVLYEREILAPFGCYNDSAFNSGRSILYNFELFKKE
ncbi:MAG: hypothetical protein ACP5IB_07960 [Thermoplasmata archaeon]